MSDVPLGVFLSGGVDSSAVAALMTKIRQEPVETFSVGYTEQTYSELPFARAVADHIKSKHHEVLVSEQDFFRALPHLIWHEDEPIVWPSSVALYFVARSWRANASRWCSPAKARRNPGGLYPVRVHAEECCAWIVPTAA